MPPLPQISAHDQPLSSLLPHLLPLLPYSLPLVRRLQLNLVSPYAQTLATFSPASPAPSSFAACHVDRSRAPETEAWIFSTYELPTLPASSEEEKKEEEARAHLLALLSTIASRSPGGTLILGSVHASLLPLLAGDEPFPEPLPEEGPLKPTPHPTTSKTKTRRKRRRSVLNALSAPYQKWLIHPSSSFSSYPATLQLPEGYKGSTVRGEELALVVASTSIPRSERTLGLLRNICVRHGDEELVSWGFLGLDGSLSSLYTRPEHRGRGLARWVAGRLVRGEKEEGWGHCDIAVGNLGSAAVVRGIGGVEGWVCRWVGVDLEAVREVVGVDYGGD